MGGPNSRRAHCSVGRVGVTGAFRPTELMGSVPILSVQAGADAVVNPDLRKTCAGAQSAGLSAVRGQRRPLVFCSRASRAIRPTSPNRLTCRGVASGSASSITTLAPPSRARSMLTEPLACNATRLAMSSPSPVEPWSLAPRRSARSGSAMPGPASSIRIATYPSRRLTATSNAVPCGV